MIIDTRKILADKNPLLQKDEIAYEIDKDLFKIGDGKQNYNSIGYDTPTEEFKNTVHFLFESKKLLIPGAKGKDGIDGKDGKDGLNGKDGGDGIQGKAGQDGKKGTDGRDGKTGDDGKDGIHGDDGKDGRNGKDGKDGKDGLMGIDGKDGKNGKDGKDGFQGEKGRDGSIWHVGRTEPEKSLGANGDMYLNISNQNFYHKIKSKWMLLGAFKGEQNIRFGGGGSSGGSSSGTITTAPAVNPIGVIVDYYGSSATRALMAPNSWEAVVINGVTYKRPLYL